MKKDKSVNQSRPGTKKPLAPLYYLVAWIAKAYYRIFFGLRLDNTATKNLKEPMLVLCNHQSNYDFFLACLAMMPRRLNFMVSTYFYKSRFVRGLLQVLQTIPKHQFNTDISSIKHSIGTVKAGNNLAIFPEGQVSYSGRTSDIDFSISKLIKKLGVTVVNIAIRGHYMCFPKYSYGTSSKPHRGRIEVTTSIIATAEDVKTLSENELYKRVNDALWYDDYEWQRRNPVQYHPEKWGCEGIDKYIYTCPVCNQYFTITSLKDKVFCEECGYTVVLDHHGFFKKTDGTAPVYDTLSKWYVTQKDNLAQQLQAGNVLPICCSCKLTSTLKGKHGYFECGSGYIALDDEGILFEGTKDEKPFSWRVGYASATRLAHNSPRRGLDLPYGDELLGIVPDEKHHMIYIIEAYNLTRKLWEKKPQKRDV